MGVAEKVAFLHCPESLSHTAIFLSWLTVIYLFASIFFSPPCFAWCHSLDVMLQLGPGW